MQSDSVLSVRQEICVQCLWSVMVIGNLSGFAHDDSSSKPDALLLTGTPAVTPSAPHMEGA